ncbi:MAG: lipopolysaccharide heptosyltransferase II [Gammaproteobacteria bacterium]
MTRTRVLVAAPSWVGDLVMACTLFKLLKTQSPEAPIDVLAPAWALPLAARMAEIDTAIELPAGHGEVALGVRWRLARQLRERAYSHAYILPRSAKAALVPWLARIPRRIGYRGEMRYGLINRMHRPNPAHERLVERYAALAFEPGAPLPESLPSPVLTSDPAARRDVLERLHLEPGQRPIILCPGAEYGPAKRWPIESYAALAMQLCDRGRVVWVVGSARERALADHIAAAAPEARNLAGETTLVEAVDVLAEASAVVCNDSGLMHVAAALGRPLVALYGSSSPRYTPPATPDAQIIYHDLECSPCFARECPLGHFNCLRGVTPTEVMDALERLG